MKRFFHISMVVGSLFFVSGCAGETPKESIPAGVVSGEKNAVQTEIKSEVTMTGKIIKIQDDMILVAETGESSGLYQVSSTTLTEDMTNFSPGDTVEIGFSGMVLEIYPAIIGNPDYMKLLEKGEDFVGLYTEVLNDLFETDPGLNEQINFIAVNLTKETNLTSGEKNALLYLLWNKTQIETRMATYDELLSENLITVDKTTGFSMLEDGVLFNLSSEKAEKGKFKFSADKWRSALGAYFFHDCTATKENGKWVYTIGAEMIS